MFLKYTRSNKKSIRRKKLGGNNSEQLQIEHVGNFHNSIISSIKTHKNTGGKSWSLKQLKNMQKLNKNLFRNIECFKKQFENGIKSTRSYIKKTYKYNANTKKVYINTTNNTQMIDITDLPSKLAKLNKNSKCKMVVLGTFELIAPFYYYNEEYDDVFTLLSAENWTEELNEKYVSCALLTLFNNRFCDYPICLILPKDLTKLRKANGSPRATLLELTMFMLDSEMLSTLNLDFYEVSLPDVSSFRVYLLSKNKIL